LVDEIIELYRKEEKKLPPATTGKLNDVKLLDVA